MNRQRKKQGTATLMDVLNQSIEEKERDGHFRTAANYRSSMNKLAAYLGAGFRHLTFGELTSKRVREYVEWLTRQHPEAPGTAEFYLRNLRAMCRGYRETHRLAWAEGSDPFTGAGFRTQPTSKRALSAGLLTRLFSPELRKQLDESRRESLDVLHFIFFMRGMVFQDIWNLRHDMIGRDGHIRYRRSKTGIPIEVEIPPEAEAIINRYFREDSPYVFPFLHHKKEKAGGKRQDGSPTKKGEGGGEPVGRERPQAREPARHGDRQAGRTVHASHHLRAQAYLGDADAGSRLPRGTDRAVPGPYFGQHHPYLPLPHLVRACRYGSERDVQPHGTTTHGKKGRHAQTSEPEETQENGQGATRVEKSRNGMTKYLTPCAGTGPGGMQEAKK